VSWLVVAVVVGAVVTVAVGIWLGRGEREPRAMRDYARAQRHFERNHQQAKYRSTVRPEEDAQERRMRLVQGYLDANRPITGERLERD
jgi:Zn-finger nucleic acid-binding protein